MTDYLLELRRRTLYSLLATLVVCTVLCFFANPLYQVLTRPLRLQLPIPHLIATEISATFLVPMKFVFFLSLFLLIPFYFYHLWAFVAPALYKKEKKVFFVLLFPSVLLFYLGVLFGYFVLLPLVFKFFVKTTPMYVQLFPDISRYLDFTLSLLFALGLTFEVPIIMFVLVYFDVVTVKQLRDLRRYMIVVFFIVAMLITPPDVFSQLLLAIPMCLLYELGLIIARVIGRSTLNDRERPEIVQSMQK